MNITKPRVGMPMDEFLAQSNRRRFELIGSSGKYEG